MNTDEDRSAVEGWSKSTPGVAKWTKLTVAKHIGVGGLGATIVGTPEKVADEFERWVAESDVDGFNIVSRRHNPDSPANSSTGICHHTRQLRGRDRTSSSRTEEARPIP